MEGTRVGEKIAGDVPSRATLEIRPVFRRIAVINSQFSPSAVLLPLFKATGSHVETRRAIWQYRLYQSDTRKGN